MDILKAILNQILLFFDAVGENVRRLSPRGRRRLLVFASVFLLLVILIMILCVSSCRRSGEAITVEVTDPGARTRVRYEISDAADQTWREGQGSGSSNDEPDQTPPEDEPTDEPSDDPDATPDDTENGEETP